MLDNLANTAEPTRFGFGRNWLSFIGVVDEARIRAAGDSLLGTLQLSTLSGRTFLDIGCGSGLFSLAACQLGAAVRSFDCDQDSVLATTELRRRFAAGSDWRIERGSILDPEFVAGLGRFDVGTRGGCCTIPVISGGPWTLQHGWSPRTGRCTYRYTTTRAWASRVWRHVKHRYNTSGPVMRAGAGRRFRGLPASPSGTECRTPGGPQTRRRHGAAPAGHVGSA